MKRIDRLIIKSFLGPFVITFFIALFVLVMQFLWKYVDDLVGKGLEVSVLLELVFWMSFSMVPLAMPLAVLLSSIITFGNLGEHYELVAIKSAGISLRRFMLPLFTLVIGISCFMFFFSNNLLPMANLKFRTLLYSMIRKRPTLDIKVGEFYNGIDGYTILLGGKNPDNITIYEVMIWDHTSKRGNDNVLTAKEGQMFTVTDKELLVFRLFDGAQYEEIKPKVGKKNDHEQMRTHFKEYEITFDMSAFGFNRKDERIFETKPRMLNLSELKFFVDSLNNEISNSDKEFMKNLKPYFSFVKDSAFTVRPPPDSLSYEAGDYFYKSMGIPLEMEATVMAKAQDHARSVKNFADWGKKRQGNIRKRRVRYEIAYFEKFSLSFACIVMFLIGGPFGAIIRKGGLGLPIVASIILFMAHHILNTIGIKTTEELVISPFHGMWLATYVLLPIGLFLLYKATNDSALLDMDAYSKNVSKLWKRLRGVKG